MRLITLLFISVLFSNLITAQTSICKEDGRFMGAIQSTNIRDEIGLMQNFKLDMQWWTLLGEPTEYYDITWESSGQYKIEMDGELRFMKRSWLGKYPDLLNRFNRITPVDLKIEIAGYAYANNKCENQGSSSGESSLVGHVTYLIPDANLVPSYAGNNGRGIVPGSEHWNQFISWSGKADWCQTLNSSNQCDYSNFERGDKSDKELLRANKSKFRRAETIDLSARLFNIEWPETELRNIIAQYDKYEKGTETPPKSIVDELNQELSDLMTKSELEYSIVKENGLQGVQDNNGAYIIPLGEYEIESFDPITGKAKIVDEESFSETSPVCSRELGGRAEVRASGYIREIKYIDSSGKITNSETKEAAIFMTLRTYIWKGDNVPNYENLSRNERQEIGRRVRRTHVERCSPTYFSLKKKYINQFESKNIAYSYRPDERVENE